MKTKSKKVVAPLGHYITRCRSRNKNLETSKLVGVTVEKKIIPSYSLLMVAIGVGKKSIAKLGINLIDLYISGHFWHLNFKEGKYLYYSYFLLKDIWNKWSWNCVNNSTGTIGLNAQKFNSLQIEIPKKVKLISEFNQICKPIFELQKTNELIINKLLKLQKGWIETLD